MKNVIGFFCSLSAASAAVHTTAADTSTAIFFKRITLLPGLMDRARNTPRPSFLLDLADLLHCRFKSFCIAFDELRKLRRVEIRNRRLDFRHGILEFGFAHR